MTANTKSATTGRSGQVILLVVVAAVVLCFAALWLADVHHIILSKDKTQNAGDAAAIEGARWQASTLNLEGELNLLHVLAAAALDDAAVDAITNTQMRLMYAGPLTGFAAAQQAAKLNGSPVNQEFTDFTKECANNVRHKYSAIVAGQTAIPEPWPGAWDEYADAIDAIASSGVAAGVDNASFYTDPDGSHILLDIGFYQAIHGRDWCWFYWSAPDLLDEYSDFRWWPDLPYREALAPTSSEFLGLGLNFVLRHFSTIWAINPMHNAAESIELPLPIEPIDALTNTQAHAWLTYSSGAWGEWSVMKETAFPIDGELREEYDYQGADCVMRVENSIDRLSDAKASDPIVWIGAAKPFGYLSGESGNVQPSSTALVLPAFREARLIPLDASTNPSGGSFNLRWRRHCMEHLPLYMERGIDAVVPSCRYCSALVTWEVPAFRQRGARWLSTNSWKCTLRPGGHGGGGGSYHAH